MQEHKSIVLFGSDFDPNPDIEGVRRKVSAFIEIEGRNSRKGPYDYLIESLKTEKIRFKDGGKFPCEEWLSTAPNLLASGEIYPEQYRKYIDQGNCLKYARDFGNFVACRCKADEVPVTIAVDHALTGGIIEKLQEKNGEKLKIVIFDAHLDAIPPAVRNGLVSYMREKSPEDNNYYYKYEYHGDTFKGSYDSGSFLYWLLAERIINPENLVIIGIQDEPSSELRNIKDARIAAFIESYDSLLEQGVTIWPLSSIRQRYGFERQISRISKKLSGGKIYLSIDIDVLDGNLGEATRYATPYGLSISEIADILKRLKLEDADVVGLDLMELDVNKFISLGLNGANLRFFFKKILSNFNENFKA